MTRHISWVLAGVLVMATAAMAQEAQPTAPEGQVAPQQHRRQGRVRPRGMTRRGGMQDLNQLLNLTPEQQQQVRQIEQQVRQQRQAEPRPQRNPQDREKMRELRTQLNAAAQAGDDAKVEQLQQELATSGMAARFREERSKMYDQIDQQVLTPEQRGKFKQWRTLQDAGLPPYLISNPEAFQKAALAIPNLPDVQKNKIEAAGERYKRQATSPAATEESKQDAAMKMESDVLKELSPSQKYLLTAGNRGMRNRQGRPNRQPRDVGTPANSSRSGAPPPVTAVLRTDRPWYFDRIEVIEKAPQALPPGGLFLLRWCNSRLTANQPPGCSLMPASALQWASRCDRSWNPTFT